MTEALQRQEPTEYYEGRVIGANGRLMGLAAIAAQEGLSQFVRQPVDDIDALFETPPPFDALLGHYVIGHTLVLVNNRINASRQEGANQEALGVSIRHLQEKGIGVVEKYIVESEDVTPLQRGSCSAFLAAANAFSWAENHDMFERFHASTAAMRKAHTVLAAETTMFTRS